MAADGHITPTSRAALTLQLTWKSAHAAHTERYPAGRINIWRDRLPPRLKDALLHRQAGERLQMRLKAGEAVAVFEEASLFDVRRHRFDRHFRPGAVIEPLLGLVLEYFIRSEAFGDLQTDSIRGLPRPADDRYFPDLIFSDPVYAVWGKKQQAQHAVIILE